MLPSGFDAMGKPIPWERRAAADRALMDMGYMDREKRWNLIMGAVNYLEKDRPHEAFEWIRQNGLGRDETAVYRLVAHLLT